MALKEKRKNEEKAKGYPRVWRLHVRPHPEKVKRKRGLPSNEVNVPYLSKGQLERRRRNAKLTLLMAILWSLVVFYGAQREYNDWKTWELLDKQGEVETAPLIKVDRCAHSNDYYYATYEYRNHRYTQTISEEMYLAMGAGTGMISQVNIIADGDVSRIAGTHPSYDFVPVGLVVSLMIGLLPLPWRIRVLIKIYTLAKYVH